MLQVTTFSLVIDMEYDQIRRFCDNPSAVGWINPEGKLHVVDVWRHLEFFIQNPEMLPAITEKVRRMEEEIGDEQSQFYDSLVEGEHPEWHRFEIWESDFRYEETKKIYNNVYAYGWARVGRSHKGIHVQGEKAKENKVVMAAAKELAEYIDIDAQIIME